MNQQSPFHSDFEDFVAPARVKPEVWRLVVCLMFLFFGVMAISAFVGGIVEPVAEPGPITDYEAECGDYVSLMACVEGRREAALDEARSGAGYTLISLGFLAVLPVLLWFILPVLHRRGLRTVFGSMRKTIGQFWICLKLLLVLLVVLYMLPPWGYGGLIANMVVGQWLMLLPLSCLAILIQTGSEEVLFRGYIVQQMAANNPTRMAWMVAPSVLFGLLHYQDTGSAVATWGIVIWATMFGIAAADLTWRSGSLGPAIALHFANNASSLLLIAPEGPNSGLALYVLPETLGELGSNPWVFLPEFLLLLIYWLTCRLALRR